MLVSRLFRSLLRFLSPGIVPDDGGGAPAADLTPPADTSAPADTGAAPAASAEPADPFAAIRSALDNVGADASATPGAPAAPNPAANQARDPHGRFASASQAIAGVAATPAVPATPTQAPAAQAPAAPATPKPGEIDLTPPEGMNERSQQRWSQLTERVKQVPELERRATEASQALDSVRQLVSDAGLAPQEFGEMLDMARLFKSNSPQDAQRALQMLDGLRGDLATRFGLEAPGVDALSAHPDLKQKVDGMLMTREDALEIARLRQGNQQAQQVTREQQEHQQFQQTVQQASTRLETALGARAGTPGHDAKVAYIAQHFQNPANLQAFVKTYQPNQWEAAVSMMYDAYTPPQAAPAAPVAPPVPQPLRPSGMRPGAPVNTGPVTAEGAVANAFAAAGL